MMQNDMNSRIDTQSRYSLWIFMHVKKIYKIINVKTLGK